MIPLTVVWCRLCWGKHRLFLHFPCPFQPLYIRPVNGQFKYTVFPKLGWRCYGKERQGQKQWGAALTKARLRPLHQGWTRWICSAVCKALCCRETYIDWSDFCLRAQLDGDSRGTFRNLQGVWYYQCALFLTALINSLVFWEPVAAVHMCIFIWTSTSWFRSGKLVRLWCFVLFFFCFL